MSWAGSQITPKKKRTQRHPPAPAGGAPPAAPAATPAAEVARGGEEGGGYLSREELAKFVAYGFVPLTGVVDAATNARIIESADRVHSEGDAGNNMIHAVPELRGVLGRARVKAALRTVLGAGYARHPHMYAHANDPGSKEQTVHKDSFFGFEGHRHHAPTWAMLLYYPQKTTIKLAATAVVPGSQYYATEGKTDGRHLHGDEKRAALQAWRTGEMQYECEAGSLLLMHYDLFHRGMANTDTARRWMFKFQFVRASPPTERDAGASPAWKDLTPDAHRHVVCEYVWRWLHGKVVEAAPDAQPQPRQGLHATTDDAQRVCSAYQMALFGGEAGRGELLAALYSESPEVVRAAKHAAAAALYQTRGTPAGAAFLRGLIEVAGDLDHDALAAASAAAAAADAFHWAWVEPEDAARAVAAMRALAAGRGAAHPSRPVAPRLRVPQGSGGAVVSASRGTYVIADPDHGEVKITSAAIGKGSLAPGCAVRYRWVPARSGAEARYLTGGVSRRASQVQRTGVTNAAAEAVLVLGAVAGGAADAALRARACGCVAQVLEVYEKRVPEINGAPARREQGEVLMAASLAGLRAAAGPRGPAEPALAQRLEGVVAAIAAQPLLPKRGARGPSTDQGLRYSLGLCMAAVLRAGSADAVAAVFRRLSALGRLGPGEAKDVRSALMCRVCHLTSNEQPW
eukprot:TRINITY_DN4231_c0_g1_i7.p1 TRINITY_DN4231_c0_g1~~TRINITY_DN4231_c0_g1_i7.p1  ORF type:complete len:685 (+),score=183.24 TRINITY_DN4231_c0_g1_i7:72-2126(+)